MTLVKIAAHLRNQTRAQLECHPTYSGIAYRLDLWEPYHARPEHLFRRSDGEKLLFIFASKLPTDRYDLLAYALDPKYDFIKITGHFNLLKPALAARKVIARLRSSKHGSELVERTLECVRDDNPTLHWDLTASESELLLSWAREDDEPDVGPSPTDKSGHVVRHLYLVK